MDIRKPSNIWRTVIGCMSLLLLQLNSVSVYADGTEELGTPQVITIGSGTGIIAAGVGLDDHLDDEGIPVVGQPGNLEFTIPNGATVVQAILYWHGYMNDDPAVIPDLVLGDDTIVVENTEYTGRMIGGPIQLQSTAKPISWAYRADITPEVTVGANSLELKGLDFNRVSHGAGILVIIDEGTTAAHHIDVLDGNDFAFYPFTGLQKVTVPRTFTFPVDEDNDRVATLELHFASVSGSNSSGGEIKVFRPTAIEVTVGSGTPEVFYNKLDSVDGQEWDSVIAAVDVPKGATSVTVVAISAPNTEDIPDGTTRGAPASFHWLAAALSIAPPPPPSDIPGRMTGGGTIKVNGVWVKAALTLHCDITLSNNLQINWKDDTGKKYRWHLNKPISSPATCIDDPAVEPPPPAAPFDTFIGEGTGKLNGKEGSFVRFTFVDGGEPGRDVDSATISIWKPGDDPDVAKPILEASGPLLKGNYQAHYDQPHK